MSQLTKVPSAHSPIFNQSSGLLFQFILHEFMMIHQEVSRVKQISHRIKIIGNNDSIQGCLEDLATTITKLSGSSHDATQGFSWQTQTGLLLKLKNYCNRYSKQDLKKNRAFFGLQDHIMKTWMHCLHSLIILQKLPLYRQKEEFRSTMFTPLLRILDRIDMQIKKISHLLAKTILLFHQDENVLFFILRHQKQLENVYQPLFVKEIFCKIFPKGLKEAENFLMEKYLNRGFEHVLPIISHQFAKLTTAAN